MRQTLTFEWDEEDDSSEKRRILKADDAFTTLWDLQNLVKTFWEEDRIPDEFNDRFYEILEDNDINLDRDYP